MDEDVGVRITRLRRRMSVEQADEVASSPTPATPTKKRASKLPKPQLDNIVENAVVDPPKRATRRSMAPEPTGNDKVLTPGTGVARVLSSTSLSEAPVAVSPRAKRATRKGSFAGSDTETVSTPVRRSRRISKEFNKSPETPADQKLPPKITMKGSAAKVDVIEEEDDKEDKTSVTSTPCEVKSADETSQSSTIKVSKDPLEKENTLVSVSEEASVSDKVSPSSVRKSPRLSLKKNNSISEEFSGMKPSDAEIVNDDAREEKSKLLHLTDSEANKSLPVIGSKNISGNKKRSKSFTKFDESKEDDQLYYSDNERRKSKSQKKINAASFKFESKEIGDHENNKSSETNITLPEIYENKENEINTENGNKSKIQVNTNILSDKKARKSSTNISGINKLDITTDETHVSSIEKIDEVDSKLRRKDSILKSGSAIKEEEGAQISSIIFLEDSDVNSQISDAEPSKSKKYNSAPNVVNVFEGGKNNVNNTCEPMDVDETIPEINTTSNLKQPSRNTSLQDVDNSKIKSNESTTQKDNIIINISKSDQTNVNLKGNDSHYRVNENKESLDKSNELARTSNDSKSTLILSLNSMDKSSEKNTNKRSMKFSNNDDIKCKSFDVNMNKESVEKKNLSANGSVCVTSIRNKVVQNVGIVTSTPVTAQCNKSKKQLIKKKKLLKQEPVDDEDIENSCDDDNSSDDDNSLLDDEAEEADGYESGDSQDESEREYAEQNEVPVGGDTLDSDEDDESDDSEYEKDSFLVSSDEKDDELLSGSGDDLSMSDKELKMTSKSKKKYDERKMKEQKQASREMFEARHGKKKAVSDDNSEDPDIIVRSKSKKSNRLRLDSSKDLSDTKICDDEPEMSIIAMELIAKANSHDPNVILENKNKKRNRLRLDSSTDLSDGKIGQDELEMSIIVNKSIAKDPLTMSIKKEILDTTTANNTVLEEIENVNIDQDVTIFSNKEPSNPLNDIEMSDASESSDDGGIADSYDFLLKELNDTSKKSDIKDKSSNVCNENLYKNSDISLKKTTYKDSDEEIVTESKSNVKGKKTKKDLSFSEYKRSQNTNDNSILDKLNLTASRKEKRKKSVPTQPTDDNSQPDFTDINTMDISISNISKEEKGLCLTKKKKSVNSEIGHAVDVTDSKETDKNSNNTTKGEKDLCATKKKKSIVHELHNAVDITDSQEKVKNVSFTEYKPNKAKKDNSVVDKLNLTESGKEKKSNKINKEAVSKTQVKTTVHINQNESSSDSIDFKLLFVHDEDSNDTPNNNQTDVDNFIPLKKSEARINLLENKNAQNEIDVVSETNGDLTNLVIDDSRAVKKSKKSKHKPLEVEELEIVQPVEKPKRKRRRDHADEGAKQSNDEVAERLDQGSLEPTQETSRKRKERAHDIPDSSNKVFTTGTENKRKIQRLPASIIEKLEDRPPKIHKKTARITSTSNFEVQTIASKRHKPSAYLEESIHIDTTPPPSKNATKIGKLVKVLPSLPKASTSTVGFTSNFKVNILKQEKRHDAKLAGPELVNFKTERLYGPSTKRMATEELCRKHKKLRTTKF